MFIFKHLQILALLLCWELLPLLLLAPTWLLLKGHGNEADFLGFLHKSVRHRSLVLHFEPFLF
jgi:hypothetical protein